MSKSKIDVSIIIVSYNTKDLLKQCVESVLKYTKKIKFEIIIVENASTDDSLEYVSKISRQHENIKLVKSSENIGFGPGNNLGIKKSKGEYVLFLNSDTEIKNNVIREMIDWMDKHPKYGIAGAALKNPDGSYQGSGGYFPNLINVASWMTIQDLPFVDTFIKPFHPMKEKSVTKNTKFYKREHDLDWITGAFMLFRREVLNEIIGFDEDYFMYTEEVDLCFRARKAGWKVAYLPQWEIIHFGGASSTKEFAITSEFEGVKTFFRKHYPAWQMPILRFFLKLGSLLRMIVFGKVYWKAFQKA